MAAYTAGTKGGVGTLQSTSGFGAKYGELSAADAFTIQKKFLTISKKLVTMARFAQKDTKPLGEGNEVRYRRYERFQVNTDTISEGVTPNSDTLRQTTIKLTLEQYGAWVPITDRMMALSGDPIVAQITERQAIQMAEQMDTLAFDTFKAGSSVHYSDADDYSGTSNEPTMTIAGLAVYADEHTVEVGSDRPSAAILKAVERYLEGNDTVKISNVVKPASAYGTEPVAEGYFAITHPDLRKDIETLPGFSPVEKYANYGAVMAGEIGKVGMIRFIATTLSTPVEAASSAIAGCKLGAGGKNNIYKTLVFGKDAVGCASLSGKDSVTPTVITPQATSEDPLGQRGSVGYSYYYGCKILNDAFMTRIESFASK